MLSYAVLHIILYMGCKSQMKNEGNIIKKYLVLGEKGIEGTICGICLSVEFFTR